jgi:hypothetical protein
MGQVTPISSAAFELAKLANGGEYHEVSFQKGTRFTSPEQAQAILDFTKEALKNDVTDELVKADVLAKAVTISTGLTAYDLRAPSLLFSPTITPIRNSLKRTLRPNPGNAANWKVINALTNAPNFMAWVPEGRRAASITYSASNAAATYASMGTEDSLTDESKFAAQGFEDEEALVQMRSLYKLMQIEECALLHGNANLTIATPAAPTLTAAGTGATLPALTYSVICVALSAMGFLNATTTGTLSLLIPTSVTSNDGQGSFTLNGGSSAKSTAATQAVTLGQTLSCSVAPVNGAVAYAWFVGASGAERLSAITTINSATFAAPLAGTGQLATAITADWSRNATAYDGLQTLAYINNSQAYIRTLATGTAGAGTQLTSTGSGEVSEIRDMLKAMWDNYRLSVTKIYVSSQELVSITKLVLAGGSAPLVRLNTSGGGTSPADVKYTAGAVVGWYFNAFTADGGRYIPIILHPNMVAGTIFGYAENLPATYMSNETPTVAELLVRQDYYVEKWARTSRAQSYGTYCQSVPAVYAPFALAIITNIAPTV